MAPSSTTIFTIGHGTRGADAFMATLHRAGVQRVVDVRVAPGSSRNPPFGRDALERTLDVAGIVYEWRKGFGGFRRPRPDSGHVALRSASFRGYAEPHGDARVRAGDLRAGRDVGLDVDRDHVRRDALVAVPAG